MLKTLNKNFAEGGSKIDQFSEDNIYDLMKEMISNQKSVLAWLAIHTHALGPVSDQVATIPSDNLVIE